MTNNPALAFILALSCSLSPALHAQDAKDAPEPTAPFLSEVKDPLTINRAYVAATEQAKHPAPGQLLLLGSVTEVYGPVRRVLNTYAGKPKPMEFWVSGGVMMGMHPLSTGSLYFDEGVAGGGQGSDLTPVFPEAKWVSLKNFSHWEKIEGRLCRVHTTNLPPTKDGLGLVNPLVLAGETTAWIADDTRLPVKVKTESDTINFTYGPGPTSPLVLPPGYANLLQGLRHGASGQMR